MLGHFARTLQIGRTAGFLDYRKKRSEEGAVLAGTANVRNLASRRA